MGRQIKKLLNVCLLGMLVLLLLSGCGKKEEKKIVQATLEETEKPVNTPKPDEVSLVVARMASDEVPVLMWNATELKYFEEMAVNVSFYDIATVEEGLEALKNGVIDILPYGNNEVFKFISEGNDGVIIGSMVTDDGMVIAKQENLDKYADSDISDLQQVPIGFVEQDPGFLAFFYETTDEGVAPEYVQCNSYDEVIQKVLSGEVQLGIVPKTVGYDACQQGAGVCFSVEDYIEHVDQVQVTTSKVIQEKRAGLVRYEQALLKAYDTYCYDTETTLRIAKGKSTFEEEKLVSIVYGTADFHAVLNPCPDPYKFASLKYYEVLKVAGIIDPANAKDLVGNIDDSIYKEALDGCKKVGVGKETYEFLSKLYDDFDD